METYLIGELSVDEEVGDLNKGGLLGELLNRVSTVAKNSLASVNVRNS